MMNLLACIALTLAVDLGTAREEVHHIHSENGRNVHIHLHEVGACSEEAHHHHHHDAHEGEPVITGHAHGGHSVDIVADEAGENHDDHAMHHTADDDIHIHIHEAGENCTSHKDHGGSHEGHGMHGEGRSSHSCAMCARALGHHGGMVHNDHSRDHPGHHGSHSHGEDADSHDHSEDYVYAHCEMAFNKAAEKKNRMKIKGAVHMRQLIYGGPVEMQVNLKGFKGHTDHVHGFHVHEFGDMSNGCESTGSHFNPFGLDHGAPDADIRHAGDYGNIRCDSNGVANVQLNDTRSTLIGHHNIIGRAFVIHANEDDMGLGGVEASKKSGNAGGRLACCIIVRAKPHGDWGSDVHDHSDGHHDHGDHADHPHEGKPKIKKGGKMKKHDSHKKHGHNH